VLVALALAAPAFAHKSYEHGTALRCTDCHTSGSTSTPPSNADCVACHTGFKALSGQLCYQCHAPNQVVTTWQTSAGCSIQCHLFDPAGKGWTIAYTHGSTPHVGANYAPCLTCHTVALSATNPNGSQHHDAVNSAAPTCVTCHNGSHATAVTNHDSVAPTCTACHSGMNRPAVPASCLVCHSSAAHPEARQIVYTNDLSCTDLRCHGAGVTHNAVPALTKSCTTCHAAQASGHYSGLGSCTTCHTAGKAYHHGTATATPLADCAGCHDGSSGSAKVNHDGLTSCTNCHSGMNTPAVPAVCNTCHVAASFGTGDCTNASCHTSAVVHNATPALTKTCTDCHTAQASGHYAGLGTCTTCHDKVPAYHHLGAKARPLSDCAGCHDGSSGSAKVNHDGLTSCTSCHAGMDRPSVPAVCLSCHSSVAHPEATQIAYTNNLSCADSRCHAAGVIHTADPVLSKSCTDCHTAQATGHYSGLGSCTSCHTAGQAYHHGTATAGSPSDCTACHDGVSASAKVNHDGLPSCTSCHSGMDKPAVPAVCNTCHTVAGFGTGDCTSSSCHTSAAVHNATPNLGKTCTDCHTVQASGHYAGLGSCTTCHDNVAGYHHLGATARPLADCAGCHDGGVATAKADHGGLTTCNMCHIGMNRPTVPGACKLCHPVRNYGAGNCADAACHTGAVVHNATPALAKSCADCHVAHFVEVGGCDACHASSRAAHHAAATLPVGSITASTGTQETVFGTPATVTGVLTVAGTPLSGVELTVESRTGSGDYVPVAAATTTADGSYTAAVDAPANGSVRVIYRGDVAHAPATASAAFGVHQLVTLRFARKAVSVTTVRLLLGGRVNLAGAVLPNHAILGDGVTPGSVKVTAYRAKRSVTGARTWVKAKAVARRLSATSGFSWRWKPLRAGVYKIVATIVADGDHLGGVSRTIKVIVRP
jgi:hypothetical protein